MALAVVSFDIRIDHDGRKYDVHIPELSVPKCAHCNALSIDDAASEQIDKAFREKAKLLTAEEIRHRRETIGLNQQEFAKALGVSPSTVNRWENGAQVQQQSFNTLMQAFFDVPAIREYFVRHNQAKTSQDPQPQLVAGNTMIDANIFVTALRRMSATASYTAFSIVRDIAAQGPY